MALAVALERTGHAAEALTEYREAAQRDRQLTGAELAAARLLTTLHQTAEAEQILRRLVDGQPGNAAAWEALGDLLSGRPDSGEARVAYERASKSAGGEQRRRIEKKRKRLGIPVA
jgi:Flp pilus assembly protein TadD